MSAHALKTLASETSDPTEKLDFACPHLSGYWIDPESGCFRCFECGHQFHLIDLSDHKREIETWMS